MMLFTERLQLEREFYEWAEKNFVSNDPLSVITWLLEIKGFVNPDRIKTLRCRKLVEKSLLMSSRYSREDIEKYMIRDMVRSMAELMRDEITIQEEEYIPEMNMKAFIGTLQVVTPEDLSRMNFGLPEVEK